MRINNSTALRSKSVLLVPYSRHHVPEYHNWMSCATLRELTVSDELTLEEEYECHKDWCEDKTKLTFISCDSGAWCARTLAGKDSSLSLSNERGSAMEQEEEEEDVVAAGLDDGPEMMRGDVNMFFHEDDDVPDGVLGETSLMVAVPSARGQGFGKHMLMMFLAYVLSNISAIMDLYAEQPNTSKTLTGFVAKIVQSNDVSIRLFEKLGFVKTRPEPNYFGEVELRIATSEARRRVEMYFREEDLHILRFITSTEIVSGT